MGRVTVFQLAGIDLWIPSGDHDPPHFHAHKPGHWHVKVLFLEQDEERMILPIRPPDARVHGKDRRALVEGVRTHRHALLAQWDAGQTQL